MPLSRYLKIYPCTEKQGFFILYSTKKGSVIRVSAEFLAAARNDTLSEADHATLARLEIITEDLVAERETMGAVISRANRRQKKFRCIVVLNLDCNLACPYCYEDHFRGRHYMTSATANLLMDFILRNHIRHGHDVEVDFYGGEPLLSIPMIKEISRSLLDVATAKGIKFSFGMVTNGTLLTRQVVEELLPLGFTGAKLTIDGPRDIHNLQRPFVSGKGSFDTIVNNIKAIFKLVRLQVGGNFTEKNYRLYPLLLDHLLKEGIKPEELGIIQFAPVLPKSGHGGGSDFPATCNVSTAPWLAEAASFLQEETLKRGFQVLKPTMSACMIEFVNDLVINFDGTLFKCPALMGWPELSIGSLADGVTEYSSTHNMDIWKNEQCLECAYLPICFGGCRFLTMLKNGVIDDVDCRKEFYDMTLEKTIRQDLRYRQIKPSQARKTQ